MRYDKRVQIIKTVTGDGYLGATESESDLITVNCAISGLTNADRQTYFAPNYKSDAYRIHLLGNPAKYEGLKYVVYRGAKREIISKRILRNRLVVIVS
jgi:hypothetical protein